MDTRIKICGLTRPIDALRAEKLGADFLGFIFYRRSPRYISPTRCRKMIDRLDPATRTVGVFVDEDIDKVISITRSLRFSFVQLHGLENSRYIKTLRSTGIKVIKSVPVTEDGRIQKPIPRHADLILFDTFVSGKFGGTGKSFKWSTLKKYRGNCIIAGGITSDNVGKVIKLLKPYAVDISNGVESAPGIKSPAKLTQFFKAVKRANA